MKMISVGLFASYLLLKLTTSLIRIFFALVPFFYPVLASLALSLTLIVPLLLYSPTATSTKAKTYLDQPDFFHYVEFLHQLNITNPQLAQITYDQQKTALSPIQTQVIENALQKDSLPDTTTAYWQHVVNAQPTARDALFNLYLINQSKNNNEAAKNYLHQAQELDPNYHFSSGN